MPAREYLRALKTRVEGSNDPGALRIRTLVSESLPPGWENTFVLHDCLLVSASLTESARLMSHGLPGETPGDPREGLEGQSREFQSFLDRFAVRWLDRKYPLLGVGSIQEIVKQPSSEVLPVLGEYNRFSADEAVALLGPRLGFPNVGTIQEPEMKLPAGFKLSAGR